MPVREFRELRGCEQAYDAATTIFGLSREWPEAETYSLTDQIRRSSRSVRANIAEAVETRTGLQFGRDCGYLSAEAFDQLDQTYNRICGGLVNVMQDPGPWCGPGTTCDPGIPYGLP